MAANKIYLYGYDSDSDLFRDLSVKERVDLIYRENVTGVFGGYKDPAFVKEMHSRGLKVNASFKCFAGSHEWELDRESRPIKEDGTPLEQIEWYCGLNPGHKIIQEKRLNELEILLKTCDIDGIWFDFIRWPCKWEKIKPDLLETSFDKETVGRFLRAYDIRLKGSHPEEWSREIWPIIQSVDTPQGPMSRDEYQETYRYTRDEIGCSGLIIFSLEGHYQK